MPAVPPETQTANYAWIKPFPTGSTSTWGATLNADLDAIDAQVKTNANAATIGVIDGSDAAAGKIGEVISSNVSLGSAVAAANGVTVNVTNIALTAGDWEVVGEVWCVGGTGAPTAVIAAINSVSATIPVASAFNTAKTQIIATLSASVQQILSLRSCRVSLSAPATYYLVAQINYPSGSCTAYGNIIARRVR